MRRCVCCAVCTVGKLKENGTGGSKKDAKREAAQKVSSVAFLGPTGTLFVYGT